MNDEFYRQSTVTGKSYDVFKTIKILNASQCAFYMHQGVELRDIKQSFDKKTGKPILVYYFYRDETKEAYDTWCKQKDEK